MRGSDPIEDFNRQDAEEAEYEKLCPVCDLCGEPITDDYYYMVSGIVFHLGCAVRHSVDDYIEQERQKRWNS